MFPTKLLGRHAAWLVSALVLLALVGAGVFLGRARAEAPPEVLAQLGPTPADLAAAQKAVQEKPDDATAQLRLGSVHLALGDLRSARTAFAAAARKPQTASAASDGLRKIARATGEWVETLPDLEEALVWGQRDPRVWANYIVALTRAGQLPKAEAAVAEGRHQLKNPKLFPVEEAELLAAQGSTRRAADLYEAGLKQSSDSEATLDYALLLARMGARQRAQAAFQRAVELDPSASLAYLGLAKIHLEMGRVQPAEEAAFSALQVTPDDPEAMYLLGRALEEKGGPEPSRTAEELFGRVLVLNPRHEDARYHRGVLRLRAGDARSAIRDFEDTLSANPRRLDARQSYVRALQAAGEKSRAAEQQKIAGELAYLEQRRYQLTQRVSRSPRNTAARCDLAEFYAQNGATPMARREFQRVLEQEPDNQRARAGLERLGP